MQKTSTFLMFIGDNCGKAEEAINFYVSLFDSSKIEFIDKWAAGEPGGIEGLVKQAKFTLAGQEYRASENTMDHKFTFTPAISLFVNCESEEELNRLFAELSKGGQVLMPVDNYGFSKKFGWTNDKFGISWQLNFNS